MMVDLTRRYRFSAAHRLHNDALSAEENARLYGKCNNPYGHGHNYILEVTVRGEIDKATGMVMDIVKLDGLVNREVIERLDHTHLNLDVEEFARLVPTTENLCLDIFGRLRPKIAEGSAHARLRKVRLEETASNFFECEDAESRRETVAGKR
jgi:6-pyruvoyltetrahydropterin/6-carboxytetrahydropterin synthase